MRRSRVLTAAGLVVLAAALMVSLARTAPGWVVSAQGVNPAATPPTTITVLTADKTIYPKFCNNFVVSVPPGTTWRGFVAHVTDPSILVSIWKYDNASQRYFGVYFADANAPTDGPMSTDPYGSILPIWLCASSGGSFQ